jgi:hypothetical protein
VTAPVTRAAFDEPFDEEPDAALRALDAALRAAEPLLRAAEPLLRAVLPLLLRALLLLRLDALALFGLLRELVALLPFDAVLRLLLRDALLFGLDPFELRDEVFRLLCDRELVWAISPP